MHRLLAFIALCLAFANPVQAQDCATLERVRADVDKWSKPSKVKPMNAAQSADFLLAFNREPPTSNLEGDLVAVVTMEDAPNVVIVIFKGDCAAWTLAMPLTKFLQLIQGVRT